VEEGVDFTQLAAQVKRTFHKYGIHSSCIQPEFVPRNFQNNIYCSQNCVQECKEDWCCGKTAKAQQDRLIEYASSTEL